MEVCSDSEETPVAFEQNMEKVFELMKQTMKKDEYWYLVDEKWISMLKRYVTDKDPSLNPGPINNAALFKSTEGDNWELRDRLTEEVDYVFVPEEAWQILVGAFGVTSENHIIRRRVIEQGKFSSYLVVELYPIELKLCLYGSKEDIIVKPYSRVTTLGALEKDMRKLFKVEESKETQLYVSGDILKPHEDNKNTEIKSLFDAGLSSGDVVTLEVRNVDGTWPSSRPRYGAIATRSSKCTPGLCGLMNLGNTCFMNSALQCMSNTPPLTEYFISDRYWSELNPDNPLGMGGEIAKSFGDLMKAMWSGSHTCLAPREFKLAVGRFAPQFSGFQQQDCQELMAFLLDGLHEDLNRVKQKPYIEIKNDVNNQPDEELAKESWTNYKKRNDSIIVDTFHGLLKSTLVCPECELVSVTFDPFCYLSLPLPVKRERAVEVTFVPSVTKTLQNQNLNAKPIQISRLMIPKTGIISDVCNAVAKVVNESRDGRNLVDPEKLVVTEVTNSRFQKILNNHDSYSAQLDDIVVYEISGTGTLLPVYLREVKGEEKSTNLFGRPFLVELKDLTYEALYEAVSLHLKQHMKAGSDDEESDTDEGVAECERTDLFTLSVVNSYGSLLMEKLERGKPIKLVQKYYMYIAADFTSPMKEKCYESEQLQRITAQRNQNVGGKPVIGLKDCIGQFTTTERLGADDPWYCPRCKKHQQATKKFDIWSLPKVLIIHLKRFSYSKFCRDKLDTLVDFPASDLNMGEYIISNQNNEKKLYDLIAVANHYGGLGGGHYTAYGKNKETGLWHYFDDSNVSPSSEESVVSKAAYVLFYVRKELC